MIQMNVKVVTYGSIVMIVLSITTIALSFFITSLFVMIGGIILLLVSIFLLFFITTFDMFKQDKILDIEALKAQGLTIVKCPKCDKENVYEDQYCIFCGEKLENHDKI